MVNKLLASTILSLAALAAASAQAAGPSSNVGSLPTQATSPLYKSILYISQDAPMGSSSPSVNARVGPLTTSKNGFGMRVNVTNVPNAAAVIAPMPKIGLSGAQSQDAVLATSKAWMKTYAPSFVQRVAGWMKVRGVSTAYFSAYQEVDVLTDAGTKRKGVMWSGTVDLDGRSLYGNPRIVDASPTYLSAEYYPKAVGEGVTANEAAAGYPNAGKIVWKTLNKDLQPLASGPSGVVDVAGAFDEPADEEGSDIGALACFIDKRNPGCTNVTLSGSSVTDAATLANKIGASGIFAFYARRAEVTSVVQSDGTYTPRLAVSYDDRTITCTDVTQSVSVGKEVQFNGDLYYAQMAQSFYDYSILNRTTRKSAIDPTSYSRSASLQTIGAYGIDPLKSLLSPFTDPTLPQIYSVTGTDTATTDFLSKVYYIAALNDKRAAATYSTPLDGNSPSHPGSFIVRNGLVNISSVPATGSVQPQLIASNGDTGGGGGGATATTSTVYDYAMGFTGRDTNTNALWDASWTFNVADKSQVSVFKMTTLHFDDMIQMEVNGNIVYNSQGGNMLAMGNSAEGAGCGGGIGMRPNQTCVNSGDSGYCYDDGTFTTERVSEPSAPYLVQFSTGAHIDYTWGSWGGGDGGGTLGYQATNFVGCAWAETNTYHDVAANIDLRPYLQNGSNVLRMKLIIADGGGAEVHIAASAQPSGCADTTAVAATSSLNWGLYDRKTKQATIVNDTGATQSVGAPVQTGSTKFYMSLASSTCGGSLAAGASCSFPVTFNAANTVDDSYVGDITVLLGGTTKRVHMLGASCQAINGICP